MRKSILVGLGLALSVAGTAVAQQPQDGQRARRGGEQAGRMEGRGVGPAGLLLKDITLTEGQRTQIAQLRKTQRQAMHANGEKNNAQREQMREARQRGDTAAVRRAVEARRVAMQQERDQHIAAIRNLLTAEQRVQFDKNVAEMKARMAQRAEHAPKGAHGAHGQRGGVRGGPGAR